jgi:hypothetical protein
MKLYTAFAFALFAGSASAFSAVAPQKSSAPASSGGAPNLDPVDKSMRGIDKVKDFDPTEGENPALQRNNKDEVWVSQV